MKFTQLYAPTSKDAPKDASLPSHIFLTRAGFISQNGSGLYSFLPLGKIVLEKITKIVREEMNKSGANEVQMGVVTSADLWRDSGRYDVFGKELLRLEDRKENDFVLAPTHEEVVVDLVRNRITSYKQLPLHLYQITTKFRDEARPRFGLLRGREFIMKDGYSFHSSCEDLVREFNVMEQTYKNIFTRLGLDFRVVEADSGAIGGSGSKEFMILAQSGEDDILYCQNCDYGANVEAATREKKTCDIAPPKAEFAKFKTEGVNTIKAVSEFFKVDPFYTIKAVIKKAIFAQEEKIVVFFVRGDEALQETKALGACGALDFADASEDEIKKAGLVAGYCGPVRLHEDIPFYIDNELKDEKNLICGANEENYHLVGVSMSNFKEQRYASLIEVKKGDRCCKCGSELCETKGIEAGHIFQLGQKYSSAMNATFLDENGKSQPFYMGCYGVGVSRLVAVMIEASHDERGCVWNAQTAPYQLDIIVSNVKEQSQRDFGESLYESLKKDGYEVIYDDRKERYGFKMSDFELIGFPYALIIGKGLSDGNVELVDRKTLTKKVIKKDEIEKVLREILK